MAHSQLALKLRVLRAEHALTIEEAAERAGVQPETISNAERGRRHPYLPTLRKIAAAYGVPVEELLSTEPLEPALAGSGKAEAPATGRLAPPDEEEVLAEWECHSAEEIHQALRDAAEVAAKAHDDYPPGVHIGVYVVNDVVQVRVAPTPPAKRTTGKLSRKRSQRAARNLQG
jgi:transcriptional regulator with XRE-family HTH domain